MPKKKEDVLEELTKTAEEVATEGKSDKELEDLVDDMTILQSAAALLKIDRTVIDIQSIMIEGLIKRLSKYEDVSKDKNFADQIDDIAKPDHKKEEKKKGDEGYAE